MGEFGISGVGEVLRPEDQVSGGAMSRGWDMEVRYDFRGGKEIMHSVYDEAHGLKALV